MAELNVQILFLVRPEEKAKFLKAAEASAGFDGREVTMSEFMRAAAHRYADEILGNEK
jgi:hypothetical protein